MAIVSFIEQTDQADVIKRILTHSRLWDEYPARAPPKPAGDGEFELEVEYVDFDEFKTGSFSSLRQSAVPSQFRPRFLNATPYSRIV